jgi:AraC-like DNA-binding protein
MDAPGLNRIIEAVSVHFLVAERRKVVKPVFLKNTIEQKCVLVKADKGNFYIGHSLTPLKVNAFYFVPAGQPVYFQHGKSSAPKIFENEGFSSGAERELYLRPLKDGKKPPEKGDVFSIVGFDARIYNTVSFFKLLNLPALSIPASHDLSVLMELMMKEQNRDHIAKGSMIHNLLKELIIHIIRYAWEQRKLRPLFENLNALLDYRLVKLIQYIENNLAADLSNDKMADIAHISVDYVGQFFKNYMGVKLQDYIENKRLDMAYHLLRTTTDNIQGISVKVGFRDQAYFSRRFKLKFGASAKEIRRMGHSFV